MAKLQRVMGYEGPRTTQRYYDHLEVEDLEGAMGMVPELVDQDRQSLNQRFDPWSVDVMP